MKIIRFFGGLLGVAALTASVFATAALAEPSNKWRIEFDNKAKNTGAVVLRVSPVGMSSLDVETKIPADIHENHIASLVRDSLKASLGKSYQVEVDDGEDVLIKKQGTSPDFELTLVSSTVKGLDIELERE